MATTGHRARQTVRPSAARSDSSPMRGRYRHAAACRPTAHPGSDWRSAKARSIPETCLRLHDEIAADYNDMIYATTPEEIEVRQGFHPQMEAQASRCRRQPGRGRGTLVHLHSTTAKPMAQRTHHECDRTIARGIQAADQDSNRSAVGRHRRKA